jgi:hypothetical protein
MKGLLYRETISVSIERKIVNFKADGTYSNRCALHREYWATTAA